MKTKRTFFTLGLFLLWSSQAIEGQTTEERKWWTFESRNYYEPLIAGVREAHISALALAWATRTEFMVSEKSPRSMWDIDVGAELPLAGWESELDQEGLLPPGTVGVGLWLPIDFHMIEDFVDDSGPIVNTDYRFGLMGKLRYGLSTKNWLAIRVFLGHESTHLGDEFSIVGQREFPGTFERINVSWEFLDLGVLYERRAGIFRSLRGGVTTTLPFQDTYYATGPGSITESPLGPVTESTNWIDPYVGLEMSWEQFFGGEESEGSDLYLSGELRWRSVYDYQKTRPGASEERQASVNLITGLKKTGTGNGLGRVSPFVRFYHGVNPHGQFRNQKDYTEFGIGLRLVR